MPFIYGIHPFLATHLPNVISARRISLDKTFKTINNINNHFCSVFATVYML